MTTYKIIDLQCADFFDEIIFKSKEDVVEALLILHNNDFNNSDFNKIEDLFKHFKVNTIEEKLNWLCDYGSWEIELLNNKKI
jgi:hypothetical protein